MSTATDHPKPLDQITHLLQDLSAKQEEVSARQAELDQKLDRLLVGDKLETLTTREVCHVLKISMTKLKGMLASGELQMWKLGGERRITRGALEAYIRAQAKKSARPRGRRRRR